MENFSIWIFAPFHIGNFYTATPGLEKVLYKSGWVKEELAEKLTLAKDFCDNNGSFCYKNPDWSTTKQQKEILNADYCSDPESTVQILGEMILHETGLGFIVQKYHFSTPLKPEHVFYAYQNIHSGYFPERNLSWCQQHSQELKKKLRAAKIFPRKEFRSIPSIPEGEAFYWTHGVISCALPAKEFAKEKWKPLVSAYSNNPDTKVCILNKPAEIVVGSGWETTAIIANSDQETAIYIEQINRFMILLEYMYVMHRILEKITTIELHELRENFNLKRLQILRRFRISTNLLLGDYVVSRFTMPERYLDIMANSLDAWHLSAMRRQVDSKSKLLDLAYTQLQDEERSKQQRRFNAIILVLTVVSVIGVAAEVSSFLLGIKGIALEEKITYLVAPYGFLAAIFAIIFLFSGKKN